MRKFDIRSLRLSFWMTVCESQHIISGSFNHFIEYGRWGSAHIDSLSIPAIQRNDFVVQIILRGATRTWNLWRIDREFQRHTDWNLQFIHDRLDVYVPNHIFSTTLARIHRRQSFIFYASHAAEHNMTMKIFTTNGHRLLLRSPSAINFAPQGFSKFFPIFHDNFDFTHTPRGCLWHGISEHASCGIIFCGGVRNCIFGLLYSCHNVVAKQFQCVPFYQSQL